MNKFFSQMTINSYFYPPPSQGQGGGMKNIHPWLIIEVKQGMDKDPDPGSIINHLDPNPDMKDTYTDTDMKDTCIRIQIWRIHGYGSKYEGYMDTDPSMKDTCIRI